MPHTLGHCISCCSQARLWIGKRISEAHRKMTFLQTVSADWSEMPCPNQSHDGHAMRKLVEADRLPEKVEKHLSAGPFTSIHQKGAAGQAHGDARDIALERGRSRGCAQPRHCQTCQ